MKPKTYSSLTQVCHNVPVVRACLSVGGGGTDAAIVALANLNEHLIGRVMELEQIAPKKIRTEDGKVWVWHCPDELVPVNP